MPKLVGRSVFFAALALPIAMVAAPLTASAGATDETAVAEKVTAREDATEFFGEPDWCCLEEAELEDVNVIYTINGIHDNDNNDDTSYDIETTYEDDVTLYDVDVYEDEDVHVHDVVHEDEVEVVHEDADTDVHILPAHEVEAVEDDDVDVVDVVNVVEDDDVTFATYSDVAAAAGPDGAWVHSTESGAVSGNDGHGYPMNDTAAWYEDVTAAAGSDGAFVEATESAAADLDSYGWNHGWDDDSDITGAYHEVFAAHAGDEGAWTHTSESAAAHIG